MTFSEIMTLMLPPRDDQRPQTTGVLVSAEITSHFFRASNGLFHGGIDMQYNESAWSSDQPPLPNGQQPPWSKGPVNSGHPPVFSPVSGIVKFV